MQKQNCVLKKMKYRNLTLGGLENGPKKAPKLNPNKQTQQMGEVCPESKYRLSTIMKKNTQGLEGYLLLDKWSDDKTH